MSDPARRARAAELLPLLVASGVLAAGLATVTPEPVGVFWDDGVYLVSARALASGAGYRFTHLPGAPGAVHFPPGYPALLALAWHLQPDFPANVAWFRLLNPLLLAIAAGLACVMGIRRFDLPQPASALAALLFATALPVLILGSVLFSEPLFLVLLLVALLVAERSREEGGWRMALAAGVLAGLVMLVRSAGIALLPAIAIGFALSRRYREALVGTAAAAAVVAPWQLWAARQAAELAVPLRGSYGPYLDWALGLYRERGWAFALTVASGHVASLVRTAGLVFFPLGLREFRPLLSVLVLALVVAGAVRAWRRAPVTVLFLLFYGLLVLVWPYSPERFAWALWPVAGLLIAAGMVECRQLLADGAAVRGVRASAGLLAAVGLVAVAGQVAYTVRGVSRHWWDLPQRRSAEALVPVAAWVNANTRPDDIVACDGEPLIHLYTGRTVVPVQILSPDESVTDAPVAQAALELRAILAASRPRWAVFSAAAGVQLAAAPLLDGANGTPRLEHVARLPGGGAAFRVVLP